MKIATAARIWMTRSFRPFTFLKEYDQKLDYDSLHHLGLYIHIPFCKEICKFCPYCKVVYEREVANEYVDALLKEIQIVGATFHGKKAVNSLYFGGGTPALMVDRIGEIVAQVRRFFVIREGIGLELHPDDVCVEVLEKLKAAGVTKISIGIQSFQKNQLLDLQRKPIDLSALAQALQKVAFKTVSMDFIFAIPGQTFGQLKADIDTAFQKGANHIAMYPFIDFSFAQNGFLPMGEEEKRTLLNQISDYCTKQGYVRTSIWTFAKKHVKAYSSMTRDHFLGFGCSATTLLGDQFKINTFSVPAYIKRIDEGKLATSLTLRFTKRQRMVYYLFWTAYTTKVDPKNFKNFFKTSLKKNYGFEIFMAKILGLLKEKEGIYHMTQKG
ncbi:MAG: radical SAM protein, partial [Anaerovorax sp.]